MTTTPGRHTPAPDRFVSLPLTSTPAFGRSCCNSTVLREAYEQHVAMARDYGSTTWAIAAAAWLHDSYVTTAPLRPDDLLDLVSQSRQLTIRMRLELATPRHAGVILAASLLAITKLHAIGPH